MTKWAYTQVSCLSANCLHGHSGPWPCTVDRHAPLVSSHLL